MFRRRAFITLVVSAGLVVAVALPAEAATTLAKKKSFSVNGKSGTAKWYVDKSGGKVTNWVTVTANDSGGSRKRCTETWWDYATKPHQHFNPGVFVNCSDGSKTRSKVHVTNYHGIAGMQVIVCDVPNTSGRITRNSNNCRGNLGGMYLHSGKRYEQFGVKAIQWPSGIRIYR